jgi:hypothetical protein
MRSENRCEHEKVARVVAEHYLTMLKREDEAGHRKFREPLLKNQLLGRETD